MNRLLVIGGSDAGISAALRAKELDPATEVTVLVADRYPNFSICGLPFYLSGEVSDWRSLAHRTVDEISRGGVHLLLEHRAQRIDPEKKTVTVLDPQERSLSIPYDRLILATGAVSARPKIQGLDLAGVFLLRWMADGFALKRCLDANKPAAAVIIGGGYIGMEMADAFKFRGMAVTVVEYAHTVLTTFDPVLGKRVEEMLGQQGVHVVTQTPVKAIEKNKDRLRVIGGDGVSLDADVILVAGGARPNVDLAASAGVEIGPSGAIKVNQRMETNIIDIYAAGDCAETWHPLLRQNVYLPLGSTAHKQGRIAGENALGASREFQGTLGTQAVKIFDWVAARTGLRDPEARAAGFDPLSIDFEARDHKTYYPGAKRMNIRITGDRSSQRLLGVQIIGHHASQISKRVDIMAAAIFNGMKMEGINDLDLSYTPPLSSPWDPVQMAAQHWMQKCLMTEEERTR